MNKEDGWTKCWCGENFTQIEIYPAVFDPEIKSWKLNEDGSLFGDKTKPKIFVNCCKKCKIVIV